MNVEGKGREKKGNKKLEPIKTAVAERTMDMRSSGSNTAQLGKKGEEGTTNKQAAVVVISLAIGI
jgi:hypothetical protein